MSSIRKLVLTSFFLKDFLRFFNVMHLMLGLGKEDQS